jgi:hypothetical protein
MEKKKSFHKINEKRASKGKLPVDLIRKNRKEQGWTVDNRHVSENGVDFVTWIPQDPNKPDGFRWYEIYEFTNWNIRGFILTKRFNEMIENLNSEEKDVLTQYPNSGIIKIIIFNYRENLRKLGEREAKELAKKNNIHIIFGAEIELIQNGIEAKKYWED